MLHQIQVAIYHPEVSKKTLLSVLDSKMTPFWSHVTPDPDRDLPSRGVPKRGPQISSLLGVPVLGPVLPRSSRNLPQNMVPGPKSTFGAMSPAVTGTIYHIHWSFFNLFLFRVTFWPPLDGKSYSESEVTWSKKWSQSKSQASGGRTDMRKFGSVGAACS